MKQALTFGISIFCLTSVLAMKSNASCLQAYDKIANREHFVDSEGGAVATTSGMGGLPVGLAAAELAAPPVGIVVTTVVGPVITTGKEAYDAVVRSQAKDVLRLLNEAEVGSGLMLEQLTEELKATLNKNVSSNEVANLVKEANNKNVFCLTDDKIYKMDEIKSLIRHQLKNK